MVGPLPEPPASLVLEPKAFRSPCLRIHRVGDGPLFFGNRNRENRFDDPEGRFGVLYLGLSREAAFVETLLRVPHGEVVTEAQLRGRSMSRVDFSSSVRLVPLHGSHIGALHLDARICSTEDYSICQRWSRAIHDHASSPDGIMYQSRHNSELLCIALFDRAQAHVSAALEFSTLLDTDFGLEGATILERYNVGLID